MVFASIKLNFKYLFTYDLKFSFQKERYIIDCFVAKASRKEYFIIMIITLLLTLNSSENTSFFFNLDFENLSIDNG